LGFIGLAEMGGWSRLNSFLPGLASSLPMAPEEALCFLIFGIVLAAREGKWRAAELLAVLPGMLGLVRISESLFNGGLRVDRIFFDAGPAEPGVHTLRFALMTAVCLSLGGFALAWHATKRMSGLRELAEAAIGSVLAAIGCATLLGYGAGLDVFTSWGTATAVPPATAAALLVLGLALLVAAWREKVRIAGEAPAWAPLPAVAGTLTLTLILWVGLRTQERASLDARTVLEMERMANATGATIDQESSAVERMANEWNPVPDWKEPDKVEKWKAEAVSHVDEVGRQLGSDSISYVDPLLRTRWVIPDTGHEELNDLYHGADRARADAIQQALKNHRAAVSASIDIVDMRGPRRGIAIYAPVMRADGEPGGFAVAEFRYEEIFSRIANSPADEQFHIEISIAESPVYESKGIAASDAGITKTYMVADRRMSVTFIPSAALLQAQGTLPKLVLAVGFIISVLMGLSVHFALRARSGQRATERSNQRLRSEIDERRRIEVQLKLAKTEAEAGSRAKSEFLASMSHEIRTPMNGVIGMASLLMDTKLTAEQRDYINTIRSSGDALLTIINEILDFSKIESGKMEIEHHPFELAPCVEETLDLFGVQASSKHIELACHIAPGVPTWIIGDVTRLRQIIANLVNNAIKFTPSGSVTVDVKRGVVAAPAPPPEITAKEIAAKKGSDGEDDDDYEEPLPPAKPSAFDPATNPDLIALEFSVRDTGIGIPPDRMDRLFKAFSQVDSSTTRKYGGTGLGLAICQRLCLLMGGDIRVESAADRGSAFIFTILTKEAPAVANSESPPPLPAGLRGGPVICVEDLPVNQARLRTAFEAWGARCIIAPDAASAKAVAAREPPSLLVVDDNGVTDPSPLNVLAGLPCPRLVLFPFGQTPPAAPAEGPAFDSMPKPIKIGPLMHAVAGLFEPRRRELVGQTADMGNRLLAEEFPLEILLAEDNAVNQKVALRFLERLGYRADVANNGREAVNLIELRRYDLVLMDMQMPEMDGLDASRQIRSRLSRDRQPKILALTANAMKGDRELCIAAGMDDHISKPVKMEEIAAAIRRHFSKKTTATGGPAALRT
jgi:signal transduction histidine kinase/CheY-like chemotaxis protein